MPSTAEKLSPTRVKLTIEIPFSDLKPHLDKAYKDIAEQVNIPGFRKGKVPAAVIDQRFGRGVVLQEAINDAIPPAYNAAIDEAKVIPMAQPEVEVTKLEMLGHIDTTITRYADVAATDADIVGGVDQGWGALVRGLNSERMILGAEAVGIGVGLAMQPQDVYVPYYRDMPTLYVRGVPMEKNLQYWGGDERGSVFYKADGELSEDLPICVPIATQITHAAGIAAAAAAAGTAGTSTI